MPSRESRLLLIVIVASAGTLLLLSRFRFPSEARAINPAPAPLERLAARATFDDLASSISELQPRVAPALRVLRVLGPAVPQTPSLSRLLEAPHGAPGQPRLVLAWRVRNDLLLAQLGPGDRIESFVGAAGTPTLVAIDPVRLIGLVGAAGDSETSTWQEAAPPSSPQYVAVAEATQGGPALRPIFLGRTDPVSDPRWKTPLLALGGAGVTQSGSMIFTLDGSLAGMTVLQQNLPVMAPTSGLLSGVDELQHGQSAGVGDIGVEVADVTGALAAATGASAGAVVAHVRAKSPAAGQLQVGDVITAIQGTPVFDAAALRLEIARRAPGSPVELSIVRRRASAAIRVTIGAPPAAEPAPAPTGLGLVLRNARDAGSEVLRVDGDGAGHEAGLAAGDLITDLDGASQPTPSALQRAFDEASSGSYLIAGVSRKEEHLVLAIRKP
ncbi:MAG: PDZ domain-containing protein [Betaproteobacteria bacterium]